MFIHRIETTYKDSVDFIGMTGSCCTDTYDQYSDLDLVIISSDLNTPYPGMTFLVDWGEVEIGYDFYLKSWDSMNRMIGSTWASHIEDVKPIWYRTDAARQRWDKLVFECQQERKEPLSEKRREHAATAFREAKGIMADIFLCDDSFKAKSLLSALQMSLTDVICLVNQTYFHLGIAYRLQEIKSMNCPENFTDLYEKALNTTKVEHIKTVAKELFKTTESFYSQRIDPSHAHVTQGEKLSAWYEELCSNYKNKVRRVCESNNVELACLLTCCIQDYLNEMSEETGMEQLSIEPYLDINDLSKLSHGMEIIERRILKEYDVYGIKVNRLNEDGWGVMDEK